MASVYTACIQCGQINRVSSEQADLKQAVCGKCKAELPVHGFISDLNGTALKSLVDKAPLPTIVDFWAPWCGPCRVFAPTYQQASKKFSDRLVFTKVDTEANPMAGDLYQIRGIPTLAIFKKGLEIERISGALPLPQLEAWIESVLSR